MVYSCWKVCASSMIHRTSSAIAYPNIALIKYWGKRDEELILPYGDSLSMTLDIFPTTTTVSLDDDLADDQVILNGDYADASTLSRIRGFLGRVRQLAGCDTPALIKTDNAGPTGAGLASSASGMAALACAASDAYGLSVDRRGLSRLARRGSGSAARSIFGRFAIWYAPGEDDPDPDEASYAEPVEDVAVDLALVVGIVDDAKKNISSREAMAHTVATSPLFPGWIRAGQADIVAMRAALACGDLQKVGEIAEYNALGMHATMLAARPGIRYLSAASLGLLDCVAQLRHEGMCAYATIDAGPNVKVLCCFEDADRVAEALCEAVVGTRSVIARPGPEAHLVSHHGG